MDSALKRRVAARLHLLVSENVASYRTKFRSSKLGIEMTGNDVRQLLIPVAVGSSSWLVRAPLLSLLYYSVAEDANFSQRSSIVELHRPPFCPVAVFDVVRNWAISPRRLLFSSGSKGRYATLDGKLRWASHPEKTERVERGESRARRAKMTSQLAFYL